MSAANSVHRSLAIVFALIAASQPAHGDEDRHRTAAPLLPAYVQECAACHVAYPPGMLPSASWRPLLNHLPRPYATDPALGPATGDERATGRCAKSLT